MNELQNEFLRLYLTVGGIDEVGRGPLAGPVVAACVVFDASTRIDGLRDSKKLSFKQRENLLPEIEASCLAFATAFVDSQEIDRINIYQASRKAMQEALAGLTVKPGSLLLDAMQIETDLPQMGVIQGDAKEECIMAASIVAKQARDKWMIGIAEQYPEYGFESHMGYGTQKHMQAIQKWGVLPLHRRSFRPVMQKIVTTQELLQKELATFNSVQVLDFVQRIREMGLMAELSPHMGLVNQQLKKRA